MIKRSGFFLMLFALCVYCLGPFLWQAITSVKPPADLTRLPPVFPSAISFDHYISVFRGHPFGRIILNSAVVSLTSTVMSVIIGSLSAFGLAKLRVKGRGVIFAVVLSISLFPPVATVSPLYLMIRAAGLRDTWWALIVTYTTFTLPMSIWILSSFFREVPDEIYRAARVDGCGPLQIFYRIFLPLAAPGIFATAILVFIFSWNEFLYALTFTSTAASRTIPVGIALFPGMHEMPWGDISAASVIVTLPLIILVLLFQKRIVEGLTAGAVKG
jgi:multiple sugar transport system permease protein